MAASAMDLTLSIVASLTGQAKKTTYEFVQPWMNVSHEMKDSLADGTGLDKANQIYQDKATVIADAETSYDLAGSLVDCFGGTITFTTIKAVLLWNTSTTASILQIGGGTLLKGTNAWDTWITSDTPGFAGSEGVLVRPGGCFLIYAPDATGYAVTAGTVDILVVKEKSTLAATFELSIVGCV